MGTQQLLLIALSGIVVGFMVFAGISLVRVYSESSNREQIIVNLFDLGIMAQTYYKKNSTAGGGGETYTGWSIPEQLRNTDAGTFKASVRPNRVTLSCNGKYIGRNGKSVIRVRARVDRNGIKITVVN